MGSSVPELGNIVQGSGWLNPFCASILIPLLLLALLLGHPQGQWFAVGTTLGMASCLGVSAALDPAVWLLGQGAIARSFLAVNALLCFGLAYLASKGNQPSSTSPRTT
jgi:serine protease